MKIKKDNFSRMVSDKTLVIQKGNYFLGKVVLHDVSKQIGIKDQKVYFAGFINGARTKLHYHEGGQVLVVTKGKGNLSLFRKRGTQGKKLRIASISKSELRTGDMAYIPPMTLHWHGASKGSNFAHIAFNAFARARESRTIWYDSDFMSYATRIS